MALLLIKDQLFGLFEHYADPPNIAVRRENLDAELPVAWENVYNGNYVSEHRGSEWITRSFGEVNVSVEGVVHRVDLSIRRIDRHAILEPLRREELNLRDLSQQQRTIPRAIVVFGGQNVAIDHITSLRTDFEIILVCQKGGVRFLQQPLGGRSWADGKNWGPLVLISMSVACYLNQHLGYSGSRWISAVVYALVLCIVRPRYLTVQVTRRNNIEPTGLDPWSYYGFDCHPLLDVLAMGSGVVVGIFGAIYAGMPESFLWEGMWGSQYYVTSLYAALGLNQIASTRLVRETAARLALGCLGAPCVIFSFLAPKFTEVMLMISLASAGAAGYLSPRNRQPATQLFQELHVYFLYLMAALMLVCISGHHLQETLMKSPFGKRDDIPRALCAIFVCLVSTTSFLTVTRVLATENYRIDPGRGWCTFSFAMAPCPIAPVNGGVVVTILGQQGSPVAIGDWSNRTGSSSMPPIGGLYAG